MSGGILTSHTSTKAFVHPTHPLQIITMLGPLISGAVCGIRYNTFELDFKELSRVIRQ